MFCSQSRGLKFAIHFCRTSYLFIRVYVLSLRYIQFFSTGEYISGINKMATRFLPMQHSRIVKKEINFLRNINHQLTLQNTK